MIEEIASKNSHTSQENDECPICLGIYYKPNQLKTCNHIFCEPCINEATDLYEIKKCPLCRKVFSPKDKVLLVERSK